MKYLAVFLILAMLCSVAIAETTSGATWTGKPKPLVSWLNKNKIDHTHTFDQYERETPIGIGLDLTVWNFTGATYDWGLDNVEVQNKWDMNNGEYSCFGVVQVDVPRIFNKIFR